MKKEMKKVFALSLISLIFLSLIVAFVYAQTSDELAQQVAEGTENIAKSAASGFGDWIKNSILNPAYADKELLTRIFFAILLGMIIYQIVESIFKNKWATWIATIIITIISIMWMPVNFVTAISAIYPAMGGAILSVIPFIILMVFTLKVGSPLIGRILWLFFMIYYFGLYIYQILNTGVGWWSAATIPYLGAMLAGFIIFVFLMDIRKWLYKGELDALKEAGWEVVEREKILNKYEKDRLEALGLVKHR